MKTTKAKQYLENQDLLIELSDDVYDILTNPKSRMKEVREHFETMDQDNFNFIVRDEIKKTGKTSPQELARNLREKINVNSLT